MSQGAKIHMTKKNAGSKLAATDFKLKSNFNNRAQKKEKGKETKKEW